MKYYTTNKKYIEIIFTIIFCLINSITFLKFNESIANIDFGLFVFVSFILSNQIRIYVTKEKK